MDVSIIIATYNREESLARTLNCIERQKFDGTFEVLVIENNHKSSFIELLCHKLGYKYHFDPNLSGATMARHFGFKRSEGEILVFIDDDISMGTNWLFELVNPLRIYSSDIGQVAGKIVLEIPSDDLFVPFSNYANFLTQLDLGDVSRPVTGLCAISCNMSIKRRVFEEAKGLNVCYYGDDELLYLSGDGECGLSRKVINNGYKVFYCAEAEVLHHVPISRLTKSYFERRILNSAIETVFRENRYSNMPMFLSNSYYFCLCIMKFCFIMLSVLWNSDTIKINYYRHKIRQHLRVYSNKDLRIWIKKDSFFFD
jgi:glycosyltransferase involved in cell wall biosynthesis